MRKTVGKLLAVTFVMLGAIVLASPVEVLAKKKVKTEKVTIWQMIASLRLWTSIRWMI